MSQIIIGIIAVAISFFFVGVMIGRIFFPAKPFLVEDIKESLMMLPQEARKNLLAWLVKEIG